MKDNTYTPILLTGARYFNRNLGGHLIEELNDRNIPFITLVRNQTIAQKLIDKHSQSIDTVSHLSKALKKNIKTVISIIRATHENDNTFDICADYRFHLDLLKKAKISGVKKLIFVIITNNNLYKNEMLLEAENNFMSKLRVSGINYSIVRINDIFSYFVDTMSLRETYPYRYGEQKFNSISPKDIARTCVNAITTNHLEICIEESEVLTSDQIIEIDFILNGKPRKKNLLGAVFKNLRVG